MCSSTEGVVKHWGLGDGKFAVPGVVKWRAAMSVVTSIIGGVVVLVHRCIKR